MTTVNGYNQTFEEAQRDSDHLQIRLWTPEGVEIHVDAGLAELIALVWSIGFDTRYSCQGKPEMTTWRNGQTGYIYFTSNKFGKQFSKIVEKYVPENLQQYNYGEDDDDLDWSTIYFHSSMIPALVDAVKLHIMEDKF